MPTFLCLPACLFLLFLRLNGLLRECLLPLVSPESEVFDAQVHTLQQAIRQRDSLREVHCSQLIKPLGDVNASKGEQAPVAAGLSLPPLLVCKSGLANGLLG